MCPSLSGARDRCVLRTAGEWDERVTVWHSYKFVGTLQQVLILGRGPDDPQQRSPLLLCVAEAGHSVQSSEYAQMLAFAAMICKAEWRYSAVVG